MPSIANPASVMYNAIALTDNPESMAALKETLQQVVELPTDAKKVAAIRSALQTNEALKDNPVAKLLIATIDENQKAIMPSRYVAGTYRVEKGHTWFQPPVALLFGALTAMVMRSAAMDFTDTPEKAGARARAEQKITALEPTVKKASDYVSKTQPLSDGSGPQATLRRLRELSNAKNPDNENEFALNAEAKKAVDGFVGALEEYNNTKKTYISRSDDINKGLTGVIVSGILALVTLGSVAHWSITRSDNRKIQQQLDSEILSALGDAMNIERRQEVQSL